MLTEHRELLDDRARIGCRADDLERDGRKHAAIELDDDPMITALHLWKVQMALDIGVRVGLKTDRPPLTHREVEGTAPRIAALQRL